MMDVSYFLEESGKNLESELNRASHQVMFVRCDMTKHGDIEVRLSLTLCFCGNQYFV